MQQPAVKLRLAEQKDNLLLAKMIRSIFIEHDAPQHGTVYSDPTTDHLFELFQLPGSLLWVAEDHQGMAGCCGIYPTPGLPAHCAELVKYYLAPEARGKGIGKTLLLKCIESAQQMGYTHLYLESLPHYAKAVSIYEKQGFKKLDKPMGNSEHPTCTIWMLKEL
jgi:putative acetyltransferase